MYLSSHSYLCDPYAAEVLARRITYKPMEKLLDSALCWSVKMDLYTVEELNRDDNLITDIVTVI